MIYNTFIFTLIRNIKSNSWQQQLTNMYFILIINTYISQSCQLPCNYSLMQRSTNDEIKILFINMYICIVTYVTILDH